jgi:hypothetical protein
MICIKEGGITSYEYEELLSFQTSYTYTKCKTEITHENIAEMIELVQL